jgi:hypothetical protein
MLRETAIAEAENPFEKTRNFCSSIVFIEIFGTAVEHALELKTEFKDYHLTYLLTREKSISYQLQVQDCGAKCKHFRCQPGGAFVVKKKLVGTESGSDACRKYMSPNQSTMEPLLWNPQE